MNAKFTLPINSSKLRLNYGSSNMESSYEDFVLARAFSKKANFSVDNEHDMPCEPDSTQIEQLKKTERGYQREHASGVASLDPGDFDATLNLDELKNVMATYDERSRERLKLRMNMAIDDEYTIMRTIHQRDFEVIKNMYEKKKQSKIIEGLTKELYKLRKKIETNQQGMLLEISGILICRIFGLTKK